MTATYTLEYFLSRIALCCGGLVTFMVGIFWTLDQLRVDEVSALLVATALMVTATGMGVLWKGLTSEW